MNIEKNSTLTYVVKTRFCDKNDEFFETEFSTENCLEARNNAFEFTENYIEIIANEGLLQLHSDLINLSVINLINSSINTSHSDNFSRIKLFNKEIISLVPTKAIFPFGIRLFFRINHDFQQYKAGDEFEIFSYEKMQHATIENHLNNLILEHDFILQNNSTARDGVIELKNSQFVTLQIENENFNIFETPFSWNEPLRQFQIDHLYDNDTIINGLYERLFNHESYDYVNFIETTNPEEIEKTVYSLFHGRGGVLYVGYHPENLTENLLSDEEILDFVNCMDHIFSKDKYLYKNVKFEIFNFNDFPVLAIIVFKLNDASKANHAYDPNKVFVRQNNKILKIENR